MNILTSTSVKKTVTSIFGALCLTASLTQAQIITSAADAFEDAGWSFWWNPNGYAVAGQPAFQQLVPVTSSIYPGVAEYAPISTFPSADPKEGSLFIGYPAADGRVGGLTGTGGADNQGDGVTPLPRATIWGYTVATSGTYSITNLDFQFEGSSVDGAYFNVFLGSGVTDIFAQNVAPGNTNLSVANIDLGFLNAGEIIYVGVAPNANNYGDNYFINYNIAAVPEPSSVMLLGLAGAAGFFFLSRRLA